MLTNNYRITSILLPVVCTISFLTWISGIKWLFNPGKFRSHQTTQRKESAESGNDITLDSTQEIKSSTFNRYQFSPKFFVLVFVHSLYITLYHVLLNFLPYYALATWSITKDEAAFISAVPPFIVSCSDACTNEPSKNFRRLSSPQFSAFLWINQ